MSLLEEAQVLKKVMDNLLYEVSKKTDLTVNEIRVLLFLYQNEKCDIASSIVENLMISKSHVSASVENLKNKEYIKKIQDIKDRKKFHIKLTKKAESILTSIAQEQEELREELFDGIDAKEKRQFLKTFRKILKNAKAINS